ncbi:MAG: hypothetical protein IKH50_12795, partial [Oscillospiraceae bacterium]|nr:hypothetical protein [Oscillospiraceae bacterium]
MNRKYIISSFLMAVMAVSVNGCGTGSVQENISLNDNSIISLSDTSEQDETAAPAESAVESAA